MAGWRYGAGMAAGAALAMCAAPLLAQAAKQAIDRAPTHSTVPAPGAVPSKTVSRCAHEWRELKRTGEAVDLTWRRFWTLCSAAP